MVRHQPQALVSSARQLQEGCNLERDNSLIEVTPEMIEAGKYELRGHRYGCDQTELVREIYMAMEIERLNSSVKHGRDNDGA